MNFDPTEAIEGLTDPMDLLYFNMVNNPSMQEKTGGMYHVYRVISQCYVLQED